jgi:hypothetical protein
MCNEVNLFHGRVVFAMHADDNEVIEDNGTANHQAENNGGTIVVEHE